MLPEAPHTPRYVGFVPIVFLALGSWLGIGMADLLDQPLAIGSIVGAVLGYLGSRAALRSYFTRRLS
jgi:apolipoprotein N-acyltransferase